MKSFIRTFLSILSLAFSHSVFGMPDTSAGINESLPPVIYSLNVLSETTDYFLASGTWTGLIGEIYRKSHERFLAALQTATTNGEYKGSLLQPFACLGVTASTGNCRRLLQTKDALSDEKLIALLRAEPTRTALVAEITIIFDGRFFQVPTRLYDASLNDKSELVRGRVLGATYITTYSKKLHQEDINTHRNDSPFTGTVGSKEARMHFWLGGTSPRLVLEMNRSVELLAELWAATLSPDATGVLAGDRSGQVSLPRVRDVVSKDSAHCNVLHGDLLVVKDFKDYFWMIYPSKSKNLQNTFFIEPRCGFDY